MGSYIPVHKDAVKTFEDPHCVQQYDMNESNSHMGIYDLGSDEGDEKYKQILQETCEEFVPTFENISYDDGYLVVEFGSGSNETSLRRRAVQREDKEHSTRGEWRLEEANREQWNSPCRGEPISEEETVVKYSSSMMEIWLEPSQGNALFPIARPTQEASLPRIMAGDQETAGFGDAKDTTQRRQAKAGDVEVER